MELLIKQIAIEFEKFTVKYLLSNNRFKENIYIDFINLLESYSRDRIEPNIAPKEQKITKSILDLKDNVLEYIKYSRNNQNPPKELLLNIFIDIRSLDFDNWILRKFFINYFKIIPIN